MAYDPVSDTWTARAPVAVAGGPYGALVNQALSFSGTAVGTLAALPSARNLPGATGIASALFVMGGTDSTNTQIVTSLFGVTPPGTAPLTYAWDFGDGQQATGENPSNAYAVPGTHT